MGERNKWRLYRALGLKERWWREEANDIIHDIIMEEVEGSVPLEEIKKAKESRYVETNYYDRNGTGSGRGGVYGCTTSYLF